MELKNKNQKIKLQTSSKDLDNVIISWMSHYNKKIS